MTKDDMQFITDGLNEVSGTLSRKMDEIAGSLSDFKLSMSNKVTALELIQENEKDARRHAVREITERVSNHETANKEDLRELRKLIDAAKKESEEGTRAAKESFLRHPAVKDWEVKNSLEYRQKSRFAVWKIVGIILGSLTGLGVLATLIAKIVSLLKLV